MNEFSKIPASDKSNSRFVLEFGENRNHLGNMIHCRPSKTGGEDYSIVWPQARPQIMLAGTPIHARYGTKRTPTLCDCCPGQPL